MSGAEWKHRPGFAALLAALAPRPPFARLVVSELSRIGRDSVRVPYVVQQIEEAGVEIHGYLSGQRISVDDELGEMQTMLHSLAASYERRRSRQRTHDALRRRAEAGAVAGGITYGYSNRRDGAGYVQREIVPEQAAAVRRIFAEVAAGRGFSRIAKGLNADGIPSPRSGRGWATSGVREIVLREMYAGRIVWNKTRWIDRGGTKVKVDRPASEWLTVEAPRLAIVTPESWRAAHARLERTRADYKRLTSGAIVGRPAAGAETRDGRFLLSGLVECAVCRGAMHATTRTGRRAQPRTYYVCAAHRVRGNTICTNWLAAPMTAFHGAFLAALRHEVLTPDVVAEVVEKTIRLHEQRRAGRTTARPGLEQELRRLDAELGRYAEAIATSGPLPSILTAMQTRERRRTDVVAQLQQLDAAPARRTSAQDLRQRIGARIADWTGLLERHPVQARQTVLRPLLAGRVVLTPHQAPAGRAYGFEARLSWGALVSGLVTPPAGVVTVVPPG